MQLPDWLQRAAPSDLGAFLTKSASPRKSGLFVRHLCRSHHEAFPDPRSLTALDAADRYEAGEIDEAAYRDAVNGAMQAELEAEARWRATCESGPGIWSESVGLVFSALTAANLALEIAQHGYNKLAMSRLVRVISTSSCPRSTSRKRVLNTIRKVFLEHFGDVRQRVAFEPSWRTGQVGALATSIYADRAFDLMPILGDALEDAGCSDTEVLNHCRGDGQHVRGCWLVDAVLQKT